MTPPPSKHLVSLMIIFSIQQQQVQGRFDGDKYKYDNQIIQQQPEIIGGWKSGQLADKEFRRTDRPLHFTVHDNNRVYSETLDW